MRRFIKSDILQDATDEQLVKIKVADQKIHVNHKRVDVAFASEKLKGTGSCKPSEKQVMEFRMESKTCLINSWRRCWKSVQCLIPLFGICHV